MSQLRLSIPNEHVVLLEEQLRSPEQRFDYSTIVTRKTVEAAYVEYTLAYWPVLPDLWFIQNGIPNTLEGDTYWSHLRFTADGKVQQINVQKEDVNPDLRNLIRIMDTTSRQIVRLTKLEAYIREHHKKVTPLPWAHQVEYGKRYLATQLLLNTSDT